MSPSGDAGLHVVHEADYPGGEYRLVGVEYAKAHRSGAPPNIR